MSLPIGRWWLIVALVTFALYAPAAPWGAPKANSVDQVKSWGVDDEAPLGPLAEMSNILHPRADRNLGYPLLYSFLVVGAYAPYLGYLKLAGRFGTPGSVYPYGLADPVGALGVMTVLAHLVTVLLAAIAAAGAFEGCRRLTGGRVIGGLLGAALFVTAFPYGYYGRTGNVDMPMHAGLGVAFAAMAAIVADGPSRRRLVWLGIGAGACLAAKEGAAGGIAGIGLVTVWQVWAGRWRREVANPWKSLGLALGVSLLALAIGSGFAIEPSRWIAHIRYLSGQVASLPQQNLTGVAYTAVGNVRLASEMGQSFLKSLDPLGVGLGLVGLGLALTRRAPIAWLGLPLLVQVLFTLLLLRSPQLRYTLPSVFLFLPFAAYAAVELWSARAGLVRTAAGVAALGVLVVNGLRFLDLTHAMMRDSRYAAAEWIAAHLPPGQRVVYFGAIQKIPALPDRTQIELATEYNGLYGAHPVDDAYANELLRRLVERPPALVIVMPDHSSQPGFPYDASVPPALYRALEKGEAGFKRVARFETPPLVPWVRRPALDYPSVNPPIALYAPVGSSPTTPGSK
jgi:4-amino-4-deoxy-L-arabinose transferase-like glycosyltransferase